MPPLPSRFWDLPTVLSQWCCVYVIVGVIFCTHLNLSLLLLCWSNLPDVAISRQIGDFLRWIESKLRCQLLFFCIRQHIPLAMDCELQNSNWIFTQPFFLALSKHYFCFWLIQWIGAFLDLEFRFVLRSLRMCCLRHFVPLCLSRPFKEPIFNKKMLNMEMISLLCIYIEYIIY